MSHRDRVRAWRALALLAALGGCTRSEAPPPGGTHAPSAPRTLPDVITGFAAGPLTTGAGFVRRTYARGPALISVTVARVAMTAGEYAGWVKTSVASFPQAALDAPAEDANGFYQCSNDAPPSCDLLIQLRTGVHLELRGGRTSSRDDVDALARGLPLRALAAPAPAAH